MIASLRPEGSARRQAGFTLIELMVAMTVMIGAVAVMLSATAGTFQSQRQVAALAALNEDASMAFSLIGQQLRMAGYNPIQRGRTVGDPQTNPLNNGGLSFMACDTGFANGTTAASPTALLCNSVASPYGSALTVSYEATLENTSSAAGVTPTDCAGNPIAATAGVALPASGGNGPNYFIGENRYFVGLNAATGQPALQCVGRGTPATGAPFSSTVTLIDNVEWMLLRFAVAHPTLNPTVPAGNWASAAALGSAAAAPAPTEPTLAALPTAADRWNRVLAVTVCLVVRSPTEVLEMNNVGMTRNQYYDCSGTLVANPDRRVRKAFLMTFALRNRVGLI